jgi:hypothetical protein
MRQKGLAGWIFVDTTKCHIGDVKWDGQRLWVGVKYEGIRLTAIDGTLIATISEKDGLPPTDMGIRICPIEPGKVLVAGAFGEHSRFWLAIVQYDGKKANINVFHQGTRVLAAGEDWSKAEPDAHRTGAPEWTHEVDRGDKNGPRLVLVGWGNWRRPLLVNLSTLEVLLYQEDLYFPDRMKNESYFSRNGNLYQSYGNCYLINDKGYLYEDAMAEIYRIDLKSGERVYLGRFDSTRLGLSSHYGPIAWDRSGIFSRLIFDEDAPVTPPPSFVGVRHYVPRVVMWPPRESTPPPAPANPPPADKPASPGLVPVRAG